MNIINLYSDHISIEGIGKLSDDDKKSLESIIIRFSMDVTVYYAKNKSGVVLMIFGDSGALYRVIRSIACEVLEKFKIL